MRKLVLRFGEDCDFATGRFASIDVERDERAKHEPAGERRGGKGKRVRPNDYRIESHRKASILMAVARPG